MKIGILGASGVVGRQMIQCLEERKIRVDELRLFAHSSIGQSISFNGKDIGLSAQIAATLKESQNLKDYINKGV